MVRRVKAYLRNVEAMIIEDESKLMELSEKCELPPQPTNVPALTPSVSVSSIKHSASTTSINKSKPQAEKTNSSSTEQNKAMVKKRHFVIDERDSLTIILQLK
jgi:hypothetical protein